MSEVKVDKASKAGGVGVLLLVVALFMLWSGYRSSRPEFTVSTSDGSGVNVGFGVHMTDCIRDRNFNEFPNRDCAAAWDKHKSDSRNSYVGAAIAGALGVLLIVRAVKRAGPYTKPGPARVVDWG